MSNKPEVFRSLEMEIAARFQNSFLFLSPPNALIAEVHNLASIVFWLPGHTDGPPMEDQEV